MQGALTTSAEEKCRVWTLAGKPEAIYLEWCLISSTAIDIAETICPTTVGHVYDILY